MAEQPQPGVDARTSNAAMAAKILAMPVQPYQDDGYVLRVVEIRGRRSGQIHQVPIAVVQMHGELYLVSPDRQRPWAQNLLADNICTILAGSKREQYQALLASPEQAIPVLRSYLGQLTFAVPQFPFALTETDEQIAAKLDQVAVFRLTATGTE